MADRAKLQEVIAVVAELNRHASTGIAQAREALQTLQDIHGARVRYTNGTYEMRLASVRATCTAGDGGLIAAWLKRAHREAT